MRGAPAATPSMGACCSAGQRLPLDRLLPPGRQEGVRLRSSADRLPEPIFTDAVAVLPRPARPRDDRGPTPLRRADAQSRPCAHSNSCDASPFRPRSPNRLLAGPMPTTPRCGRHPAPVPPSPTMRTRWPLFELRWARQFGAPAAAASTKSRNGFASTSPTVRDVSPHGPLRQIQAPPQTAMVVPTDSMSVRETPLAQ